MHHRRHRHRGGDLLPLHRPTRTHERVQSKYIFNLRGPEPILTYSLFQVPELNVQNGVLKSLSFLFEYIGEMGKDYIYAVTPLLEDALMDR